MSTLIVPVTEVTSVREHPNADRLAIAEILGWQVVVGKDNLKPGDQVLYVPPDAVVPQEWSDHWGVTQYLSHGRVRAVKLRGEPSFGFAVPLSGDPKTALLTDPDEWISERSVAEAFGITKYEPPAPTSSDAVPEHVLFARYTEIENLRNFPNILQDGEEVAITEKIHGTNCRIGVIEGEVMAGSHNQQRKRPDDLGSSHYWFPLTLDWVDVFTYDAPQIGRQVILYGEVYGKVQKLHYGKAGQLAFRAFDILVDGRYLGYQDFVSFCMDFEIPRVPELYLGPYQLGLERFFANGKTMLDDTHIREGVVVRPTMERRDPTVGRVILKYVSDAYLTGNWDE